MATKHWENGKNLGDTAPARILGNLYFVGTVPASTHIIDSGDGLIMLDSGYRQSLPLVLSHMREVGLDINDLRYILHTHGHLDHAAATAELVRMTGAKTFIGKEDADYVNGTLDLTYSKEYGMVWDDPFTPDVLLSDGDTITLGGVTVRCVATPGHTPGCMSFFFDVTDEGKTYRAALHGGMGLNTMGREFLDRYSLSYDCRDKFIAAADRLSKEPVDIYLGNHVHQNKTVDKIAKVLSGDKFAFVDPEEWKIGVIKSKEALINLIKKESEQ